MGLHNIEPPISESAIIRRRYPAMLLPYPWAKFNSVASSSVASSGSPSNALSYRASALPIKRSESGELSSCDRINFLLAET